MQLNITQRLMTGFLVVLLCGALTGALSYVSLGQIAGQLQTPYLEKGDAPEGHIQSILKTLDRTRVAIFMLIMFNFLITIIVTLILANKFTDPIISLSRMAEQIGKGHWGEGIDISSQDEIGQLAKAFNSMSRSISEREQEINLAQDEIRKRDEMLVKSNMELERLNQLKSDFLSTVSHELKTPLTAIKGYVSLIKNEKLGPVNEQQIKGLTIADERVEHLNRLISDLLDLSKIEANQYQVHPKPEDIAYLIKTTALSLKPIFNKKGISLHTEIPSGLSLVSIDAPKINQVLTNLLSNAIKFTPAGGRIEIRVMPDTLQGGGKGEGYIQVSISDTGIGLDPGEMDKIFEKFYQVDHSSTREYEGTGLGLSIAQEIVELHGGSIWVKSTKGKGSTFSFTVPKAKEGHAQGSQSKDSQNKDERDT